MCTFDSNQAEEQQPNLYVARYESIKLISDAPVDMKINDDNNNNYDETDDTKSFKPCIMYIHVKVVRGRLSKTKQQK